MPHCQPAGQSQGRPGMPGGDTADRSPRRGNHQGRGNRAYRSGCQGNKRVMRIDILTLFPPMFEVPFSFGIFQRAVAGGLVSLNTVDIRDYTHDKHHTADDYPYGGGAGMVLKPEPISEAAGAIKLEAG